MVSDFELINFEMNIVNTAIISSDVFSGKLFYSIQISKTMKKITIFFFLSLFLTCINAQPCLPDGIWFLDQESIDHFQINNPNCTKILGDVYINGDDITSLEGLSVVTEIGGTLFIGFYEGGNSQLENLDGLHNLTEIGYRLIIMNNDALLNCDGLQNLNTIGDGLYIYGNYEMQNLNGLTGLSHIGKNVHIQENSITNLNALSGLTSVGGELLIEKNYMLLNLNGFANLITIDGDLTINNNASLLNVNGLSNLTTINGHVSINNNSQLTTINGLQSINPETISNLSIVNNPLLSTCSSENLCNYLFSPNGVVDIYSNSDGCDSPAEITYGCGVRIPCLPYGNYYLNSQEDIDNFQEDYWECTELQGNLTISGSNITNLNNLNVITSIGNDLRVENNTQLTKLTGLDSLTYIGGTLKLYMNPTLINITALKQLTHLGFDLNVSSNAGLTLLNAFTNLHHIGHSINISNNSKLLNLDGLKEVDSIGASITIDNNPNIKNLNGLANIKASSIHHLYLTYNNLLWFCNVKSICEYLDAANPSYYITHNDPGCNSREEIWAECSVGTKKPEKDHIFSIFPNPASEYLSISTQSGGILSITNCLGEIIVEKDIRDKFVQIDLSNYAVGIYFIHFRNGKNIKTLKFVKY